MREQEVLEGVITMIALLFVVAAIVLHTMAKQSDSARSKPVDAAIQSRDMKR